MTSTTQVVYDVDMKELELDKEKFNKAVDILGGQEAVGKICGFSQQAASKYATGKNLHFRPEYAVKIQIATDNAITCHELMPYFDWSIFISFSAQKQDTFVIQAN